MAIPNLVAQIQGLEFDGKKIVRVISMDSDTDEVTVSVDEKDRGYKLTLPIEKVLGILGYFKKEEPVKVVTKQQVENTTKGSTNG